MLKEGDIIASFMVFEQLKVVGSGAATLRLTETSIDRANEINRVPIMDEGGKVIISSNQEVKFQSVGFSYEKRTVQLNKKRKVY